MTDRVRSDGAELAGDHFANHGEGEGPAATIGPHVVFIKKNCKGEFELLHNGESFGVN